MKKIEIAGVGELKSSLEAAEKVNGQFGDFDTAFRRVSSLDLDAVVRVVAAGTGKKPDAVKEAVWNVGVRNIVGDVQAFIVRLVNGGRDPETATPGEAA